MSDFGLAKKPNSELTRTGVAMGTLRYMAPEQFRGEHVDGRVDVYGLGVALFELLTLQDPTVPSTAQLVAKDGPPLIGEEQLAGVPASLRDVILRAVMLNPQRRYQNTLDVAQDLENYLSDQPVRATGPTRRECLAWHLSKHRNAWLTIVGTSLLLMTLMAGLHVRNILDRDYVTVNSHRIYINGNDREVATWVIQQGGLVRIFDGYQQPPIRRVEDLPSQLFNVTTVDLWDYDGLDAQKLAAIGGLGRLNELVLNNCRFSQECIQQLPEMSLISLQLNECDVTDASLEYIAKLDDLVWLGLRENDLSDDGVALLKPLLNLSEVNLSGNTRLTNRCLRPFAGKNALALVDVRGTQVSGAAAEAFQKVIQQHDLSSRVLYGEQVEETTMHGNKLYPGETDRELAGWIVRQGGAVSLLGKKGRTRISAGKPIPEGIFNVTRVSLADCDVLTEDVLQRIVALPRLEELSLSRCGFQESWLPHLARADLIGLEIRDCGLTDSATEQIAAIPHLSSLKLPFNRISDEGIGSIAGLSMLTELDLCGNAQVSGQVFDVLGPAMFTLRRIDVRLTQVTRERAADLQSHLRNVDSEARILAGTMAAR